MSGGHWNHAQYKIEDLLGSIGEEYQVHIHYPRLAQAFRNLAIELGQIEHDLDWWLSGDTGRPPRSEREMLVDILGAVLGGNTWGEA